MSIIKQIIYKLFGPNIGQKIKRVIYFLLSQKKRVNSNIHIESICDGYHTSCGYYDWNPIQNSKMLFISTDNKMEKANVRIYNLEDKRITQLALSNVVNWQQGNRLRWIGENRFIFNSFEDDKYVSVEYEAGKKRTHCWPIYDVSLNSQAVTLDFNRLGWMRPGYGYTKFPLEDIKETDCAIRIFSIDDDSIIKELTYHDLIYSLGKSVQLQNCYINHLSFSPSGRSFMFFFVEIEKTRHMCYLGVYDGSCIRFLEKELSASHYTWKNDNEILATCYDKHRNCGYYLYSVDDGAKVRVLADKLIRDGHPTYVNSECIITDTYPDKAGFQDILFVDITRGRIQQCVSIYSTSKHLGVERCDLHPRIAKDNKKVIFDADVDGHRRIYTFNIEEIKE